MLAPQENSGITKVSMSYTLGKLWGGTLKALLQKWHKERFETVSSSDCGNNYIIYRSFVIPLLKGEITV